MYSYQVGKKLQEDVEHYPEGTRFDLNDEGATLLIYFNSPTKEEIEAIRKGKMKLAFYAEDEVIMMLFKFENLEWMDAPYSVHLSKNLSELNNIDDGMGYGVHTVLVDAKTGIIKAMRLTAMPTKFSRELKARIEEQLKSDYKDYQMKLNKIIMKYTTKRLLALAQEKANL